jgi:3-deoxy-D-manno-octulosonic-acid transferase
MFFLYDLLFSFGFLVLLPWIIFQKNFRQRLWELPKLDSKGKKVIWVHCVSVGETQAARPLIRLLRRNFPSYSVIISTTTSTGQDLAKKVLAQEVDLIFYFPFDLKYSVRRALERINPEIIILMETEIWFNFIREAAERDIKICIANARLSEKSFRRYLLIRKTIQRVLDKVSLILAQSESDADRFSKLGASAEKIKVVGNLKFDVLIDESEDDLSRLFQERFGSEDLIILAASTHYPEENWILEAFKKVRETFPRVRLMIAPRHPERFDEVAELIRSKKFNFVRRSAEQSQRDKDAEVILLDSIGELRSAIKLAEIVFVGGSLIPHGGQNILEAAIHRKAIVTGFHTSNFSTIVEEFKSNKALIQLPQLEGEKIIEKLAEVFCELLKNESYRREIAEKGFHLLETNKGASVKTIQALKILNQS